MTPLGMPNSLWRAGRSITEGQVLLGVIFVEPWNITTVNSIRSVLSWFKVELTCSVLTSFPCLSKKDVPYLPQNRCAFIKCLRAKRVFFWRIYYYRDAPLLSLNESSPSLHASSVSLHESVHDAVSFDEGFHDPLSSSDEALLHSSAEPFPYDSNSSRGSVIQPTGVSDESEVGRLLCEVIKRSMTP